MMNWLLTLWEQRLVPAQQGVYFRDGSARAISLDANAPGGVSLGAPIDVNRILDADEDDTTSVDAVLAENAVREIGGVLCCGECDHGSEGYIALLDVDREVCWIAYFANSNPFVAIESRAGRATLRTSSGKAITIRTDTLNFVPAQYQESPTPP